MQRTTQGLVKLLARVEGFLFLEKQNQRQQDPSYVFSSAVFYILGSGFEKVSIDRDRLFSVGKSVSGD